MLQQIGQRIRILRTQKGIGLNAFAAKLNVSPGYLSNLETGKTDTIQLSLLEKLQEELGIFPDVSTKEQSEFDTRIEIATEKLTELENANPKASEFLLKSLEQGIIYWDNIPPQ